MRRTPFAGQNRLGYEGLLPPYAHDQAIAAGIRAFAVHAKDGSARRFYEHFRFAPSPTDPLHLYLLLKDLRQYTAS